ncbi:hypothetical protein O181_055694 [Austropuccinia psidii MF-1]|uniref:Reverse transcriptase domain-containing protein n=1 Tax=Austropuccinia psidii MF-1 TaxID=1389203 RepID=A0A9Q3HUW6_9BASI|nr:hypothetical protein [Austropuccinia psidii MF-1]
MCFESFLGKIKTFNDENSFGNKINEQSTIIKELTEKYSKFNIDDIIETRIKQAINIIKADNKKVLHVILNSFNKVKTYKIALKKCFDTSKEEVSKLTTKLNQVTAHNTRQTESWQELTHKEDMYKIGVINSIKGFQHEFRDYQRYSTSKMNDIEQLLHTLPRISTPLNKNEGQELMKELPKIKEWPYFSGEGEYDHMEFIRGIEIIKEDFELPERLLTERFNILFTRSAHRWYIKLRQAHGHQRWTWWKTQIINKWGNAAWRFKVETAFEYPKFNANKDKSLKLFFQQKDTSTALYPDMSEFVIHRKIVSQCGDILEDVDTRTRIGSSRVNLKIRFNTPWEDSVDKNTKESSNNMNYKSADIIIKIHICQSTTHLANKCPKRGAINKIYIEKGPDVEKENDSERSALLYDHKEAFASDKEKLGEIVGHEVEIFINIERPYPPLLRRPAYKESPKSREALELHVKELLDLGIIQKVGHNEEVEITTPFIVEWNNGKSIMVGEFRALNTYTVPDRYPIPKIQIYLTQISQEVYISTMDNLK